MKLPALVKLIGLWPPYLGAGVRVTRVTDDLREIDVSMKLRFWNRNYVGTQFGGSLYAMTDPFYMLMLMHHLGRDYVVWDKAATIRFRKPGRGRVTARFVLPEAEIARVRSEADAQDKTEPKFTVEIRDEAGEVVAEVEKLLYVRRKPESVPTHSQTKATG